MKKVRWRRLAFLVGIVNTLAIVACSGILQYVPTPKLDAPSTELLARVAGRQAGYELARRYPKVADNLLKAAEIIAVDPTAAGANAISGVLNILTEKDPLFAMQVKDFLSLVKFEGPEISEEDKIIMKTAVTGLAQGLRLGGAAMGEELKWNI